MSGRNTHDISPQEREVKEWKAAKRLELRNEYLREVLDPRRTGALHDTGYLRFASTRIQLEKFYAPTFRNVIPFFTIVGVIWISAEILAKRKADKEHLYRTGQVSYADRPYKVL